jgi:hypothetical protein
MDSYMEDEESRYNRLITFLLERSIISKRQFDIIYDRKARDSTIDTNISRGAYYRLLKQSKRKIGSIIYSILLLTALGVLDDKKQYVIQQLIRQVSTVASHDPDEIDEFILVLEDIIERLSSDIVM